MSNRLSKLMMAGVFALGASAAAELPYTLPTAGNTVAISTNTPMDLAYIFPVTNGNSYWGGAISQFGGGAFIRDYSPHGAYVMAGFGGHAAPLQITGAVLFDFEDATWKGFENANGVPSYGGQDMGSDSGNGEPWWEWKETEVPIPCHPYLVPAELPASLGGGPKGSFLYINRGALFAGGGACGPHVLNLETKRWSRLSSATQPITPGVYGSVVVDEEKSRYYFVTGAMQNYKQWMYYDAANWDSLRYTTPLFPWPSVGGGSRSFMDPVRRLIVNLQGPEMLWAFQLDNPGAGPLPLTVSGTLPSEIGAEPCRYAYFPPDGNFYYRPEGTADGSKLYRLIPPASDPMTNPWIADSVELNQSLPGCGFVAWYNFLFYVPSIQCLAWISSMSNPVYIFKPPAVNTKTEGEKTVMTPMALTVEPNPFHSSVTLALPGEFSLGATVKVFDLSGRLAADLSENAHNGLVSWNARGMPSGVYVATAQRGALKLTRKIVYSK